jgi:hypothetical protein
MDSILRSLLEDPRAGLHTDADGRRFFRQRRIRFETIEFSASDLLRAGWDNFSEPLKPPPRSGREPDPSELRRYAQEASRRFLAFWYRCIDVLVARSLFGRDRRIFRVPFFRGNMFIDTGIAEDVDLSAVDADLHQRIVADYREGNRSTAYRIFTLSSYLEGITDDLREALSPLHGFWQLEEEREELLSQIGRLASAIEKKLQLGPMIRLRESLDEHCLNLLKAWKSRIRQIASPMIRQAIHQLHTGVELNMSLRREILMLEALEKPAGEIRLLDLLDLFELPSRLERIVRRVCFYESRRLHEALRLLRLRSRSTDRFKAAIERFRASKRDLDLYVQSIEERRLLPRLDAFLQNEALETGEESSRILRRLYDIPERLMALHDELIALHKHWSVNAVSIPFEADPRYPPAEMPLPWNPVFDEAAVLQAAREILIERLRPVRQTANDYSLRPEHRHGILTLNPVLRLWKQRSSFSADRAAERKRGQELPLLCQRQINTADVVALLIDLAALVDVDLPLREIAGGRILREKHGRRDLSGIRFFLIPGSCYPVREIAREDFPEYRNRVIGDRRRPDELGVNTDIENGILTGAWYRRSTHCLYYPVGADQASLLRLIYTAGRCETVPAFFFALGQFVHDCMPDNLIYYRSGQRTFREVVEDFYVFEDRIRKNRDEKTGRRRRDTSRSAVRFLFAIQYARYITEALTASSQGSFRHQATDDWFAKHTRIPLLSRADRSEIRSLRERGRQLIEERSAHLL